jgi:hypothetical protein
MIDLDIYRELYHDILTHPGNREHTSKLADWCAALEDG